MTGGTQDRDSASPLASDQDLAWLAYCYLSGECSDADAAAFELRLGDDQQARQALADAVRLVEGVNALTPRFVGDVGSVRDPRPARRSAGPSGLVSLAIAAAVVIASALGLWWSVPAISTRHNISVVTESAGDGQLVALWHTAGEDQIDGAVEPAETQPDDEAINGELLAEADNPLDIPDWMLAGLLDSSPDGEALPDGDDVETF